MTDTSPEFYVRRYVATVEIINNTIRVLGGPNEKRQLREAKKRTHTCYVRDLISRSEVQLNLVEGVWVPDTPTAKPHTRSPHSLNPARQKAIG